MHHPLQEAKGGLMDPLMDNLAAEIYRFQAKGRRGNLELNN